MILPCERKSVEPMPAIHASTRPARSIAGRATSCTLASTRSSIDDTGFPKQGRHSVGVARQALTAPSRTAAQHQSLLHFVGEGGWYCGQLGKQDNCQVAVSLSLANRHGAFLGPIGRQV